MKCIKSIFNFFHAHVKRKGDGTLWRNAILGIVLALVLAGSPSCATDNQGGTGIANPPDSTTIAKLSIGAATAALFSPPDEESSLSLDRLLVFLGSVAHAADNNTCGLLDSELAEGVTAAASVPPGTYGTSTDFVTLTETDDCEDGGDYLFFSVSEHELSCVSSEDDSEFSLTMTDGAGVIINIGVDADLRTYAYGEFTIAVDGGDAVTVNCALVITPATATGAESDDVEGSCEDEEGNPITQSTTTTCEG